MKAFVIAERGSLAAGVVELREDFAEPGSPGEGEVLIETICSAFNHMDLWVARGVPGLELAYPRVSGCDGCGVVVEVGSGVDEGLLGKRVIFNAAVEQARGSEDVIADYKLVGEHFSPGAHCERFVVPAGNVVDVGDADPVEAAAFGLCALTAWSMMVSKGQLRRKSRVLITGIGGGVATSALAIARHFDCEVCVTSRHRFKLDAAVKLGADHAILDEGQDWSRDVRAWTGKRGVDMAVDSVGKAVHLACIKSLARGGAYVTPGCTTGADAVTDLARIFWNQLRVLGSTMGSNAEFREVVGLFVAGKLRPVVDRVFEPGECRAAYERLEAGEQFGKIVVRWR